MDPTRLDRRFGREAFGADPANYHAARPPYPEAAWAALRARAGLSPGIDILEIGAGTGLATGALLRARPARLVAVEPDPRLAAFLRATTGDPRLEILAMPFEAAELAPASFDLVVSATAFHWLEPVPALKTIRGLLRPGGAVALLWNVFGDPGRPDPFHAATRQLFAATRPSPSSGSDGRPEHGLDAEARRADFVAAGFVADPPQAIAWSLVLDPPGVRRL